MAAARRHTLHLSRAAWLSSFSSSPSRRLRAGLRSAPRIRSCQVLPPAAGSRLGGNGVGRQPPPLGSPARRSHTRVRPGRLGSRTPRGVGSCWGGRWVLLGGRWVLQGWHPGRGRRVSAVCTHSSSLFLASSVVAEITKHFSILQCFLFIFK